MKTVPEWLAHRPTDRRGLPIPYVNRYGVEEDAVIRIAPERRSGGLAVFMDDVPGADIDFKAQHMARQRECVIDGLCQVCAKVVPWSRRWLVMASLSLESQYIQGVGQSVVCAEPWLCERCATFAVKTCPELIRRSRGEEMYLLPVTSQRQVGLSISRGWVDGELEEFSKATMPAMWAKIVIPTALVEKVAEKVDG